MSNVSAMGPAVAANLNVYIIDEVLSLPMNISGVASALFPTLGGVIGSSGLLKPLMMASEVTIFAPNDAAVATVMSEIATLNATTIMGVLANHVINGTAAYSDRLTTSNYTSAGGSPFTFMSNSSGTYVMSANSTAKIVQSDIIIQNGVVHVIDGVLVNTASDATAAASAYSANTMADATQTEATTPVTATSMPAAASASGSSGKASGASKMSLIGSGKAMVGGFVAVVGAVIGGGFVML